MGVIPRRVVRVCLQQLILARTECVPSTHISHELGRLPVQNLYSPRNGSKTKTKQYKLLYNIAVDPKIVRLKIAPNKWKTCAGIIIKCATIQENLPILCLRFTVCKFDKKMIAMNNSCLFVQNLATNTLMTAFTG